MSMDTSVNYLFLPFCLKNEKDPRIRTEQPKFKTQSFRLSFHTCHKYGKHFVTTLSAPSLLKFICSFPRILSFSIWAASLDRPPVAIEQRKDLYQNMEMNVQGLTWSILGLRFENLNKSEYFNTSSQALEMLFEEL